MRLTEVPDHGHDYYGSASSINKAVWAFLSTHRLEADPKYQQHQLTK